MQLITVYTAFSPVDADLVRSRLEAADFHPAVVHDIAALSVEGYSGTTGGILVQVPDQEAEDAAEFLRSEDNQQDT